MHAKMRLPCSSTLAFSLLVAATIPAPDDWRKESFPIPLLFAPSIPYEGTSTCAFALVADFASDRGFTYVILWDIKRRSSLEPAELERALNVYLRRPHGAGHARPQDRRPRHRDHERAASPRRPQGWQEAFGAAVWTWNGFSKGEALRCTSRSPTARAARTAPRCSSHPRSAERTQPVWKQLREIRAATSC
jgi:hypothetical protein